MNDNIILIGMPGSGKSTVGVVLAKAIGYGFIDTDLLISQKENQRLQDIIDKKGLKYFLTVEADITKEIKCSKTVIATGGSMVSMDYAMQNLRKIGKVVYIDVELCELKRRINNIKSRGIAFEDGETLDDIYVKRTPLYKKYSDLTVKVENNSNSEEVVDKIISQI